MYGCIYICYPCGSALPRLRTVGVVSDPTSEQTRDVYAHFGLAMYLAQCLEHGIANALVFADLIPKRAKHPSSREQWHGDFDAFMESKFQATLGRLVGQLREVASLDSQLEETLRQA